MSKYGMLPDSKRRCRDVLCCLFFAAFWVGMIIVGAIGIKLGKWQRLVYGSDYAGQVCGVDSGVSGSKFITYPRTNEDFLANYGKKPTEYKFYGICVSKCPSSLDVICNYDTASMKFSSAPAATRSLCMDPATPGATPAGTGVTCADLRANCWVTPVTTASTLFRCIPVYNVTNAGVATCSYPPSVTSANDPACLLVTESNTNVVQRPAKPNLLFDQLNTGRQLWGRWFGDLARSWWVILACAVGFALLCGFIFVTLLKYCTGCMVWSIIVLSLWLIAFLTGFFYWKAGLVAISVPESFKEKLTALPGVSGAQAAIASASATFTVEQQWPGSAEQHKQAYSAMAYISTGVLIIVLAIVVACRAQIRMAIEVIKLGSEALRALPSLLLFPLTNILAIGGFLMWWVFVAACLASAGKSVTVGDAGKELAAGASAYASATGIAGGSYSILTAPGANATYTSIADEPVMNYLLIYHIFGLLWTTQFLQGIATMTVAGAVSAWYFSKLPKAAEGDEELAKLRYPAGRLPVCGALWRTVRYHLGSVAFGSLLIAFIQAVRIAVAYVQKKLEPAAKSNSALHFLLCCVQCCLKCLQCLIEVVTRNAYIFVALKGEGFLRAGRRVFGLIVNHGRVFVLVNVLGEVIMFLGKLLIATSSAFAAYVLLENVPAFQAGGADELTSSWLPVLVTLFFAYATAAGFMMIFDLSVDTVLVCYVTDIDENIERHGGDKAHAVPVHVEADKLDVKGKLAAKKAAAEASKAPKPNAPGLVSPVTGAPPV